jgi:hypothetical protein
MHDSCTTKATLLAPAGCNSACLGTSTAGCRAKDSPRSKSIRRHWNATCVADANPASCAEVTLRPSAACGGCFGLARSRRLSRRQDYAELTCQSMLFQARQQRVGSSYRHRRHRFATNTLVQWYRSGQDPERRLPLLSTYLGHVHVPPTHRFPRKGHLRTSLDID